MRELSVALAVYNGANYVREALDSILAQSFTDFELVISDGGSTDETPAILAEYAKCDSRVSVFRTETRLTMAENYNRVIELCNSEWVQMFCHDDLMLPGCLSRLHEIMQKLPSDSIGLVGHKPALLFVNGYYYKPPDEPGGPRMWQGRDYLKRLIKRLKVDNLPAVTTAMVRKQAVASSGGFQSPLFHCDSFLWMRVLKSWDYLYVPQALTVARIHGGQATQVNLRKHMGSINEHRWFWPRFLREVKDDINLDNWSYMKSLIKPVAIAGQVIAVEILRRDYQAAGVTAMKLPPSWWPLLPVLVLRSLRSENQRLAPFKGLVPIEIYHP